MRDFSEDHEQMAMCQDCGCAQKEHTGTAGHPNACGMCSCNEFSAMNLGAPIIPTVTPGLGALANGATLDEATDAALAAALEPQNVIAPVVKLQAKPKFAPGGLASAANRGQTKRSEILMHAAALVDGSRNDDYGDPVRNHERIAALWSEVFDINVTAEQVVICMDLVKTARLIQNPRHADSWLDKCGYGAIGGEIAYTHDRAGDVPPIQ